MSRRRRLSLAWLNNVEPETKTTQQQQQQPTTTAAAATSLETLTNNLLNSTATNTEIEQILLRVRVDRLRTKQTLDAQNAYLNGLAAILTDLGPTHTKTNMLLNDLRRQHTDRLKEYRTNPFYQLFPHVLLGDEHTNLFLQKVVTKYVLYPVKRGDAEQQLLEEDVKQMSRADKLAVRVVQLTDSLYSVLMLRRLCIDYGITTTAKVNNTEDEDGNDEQGKDGRRNVQGKGNSKGTQKNAATLPEFCDDIALTRGICTKDPYIELANEAMLCANHIENGITQKSSQNMSTQELAAQPGETWHRHPPSIAKDFTHDYVQIFDSDSNTTKYSKSRNFLVEDGLTGSEGDVGDVVYLKELLCHTLADLKVKQYGKYTKSNNHQGHFCSYVHDPIADDRERIPRPTVDESNCSLFGERLKCPHPKCGVGGTKNKSAPTKLHCRHEWYYRAGIDLSKTEQEKKKHAQRDKEQFIKMSSLTRCKRCSRWWVGVGWLEFCAHFFFSFLSVSLSLSLFTQQTTHVCCASPVW